MARDFPGSGTNVVRILNPTGPLDMSSTDFTIAAWIKPDTVPGGGANAHVVGKAGNTAASVQYGLLLIDTSGAKAVLQWGDGVGTLQSITSATNISTGVWTHVCAKTTAGTGLSKLFLNGVLSTTATRTVTLGDTASNFVIGARGDGSTNPYDGKVAEVAVWNVALTDAEIAALGKGVSPFLVRPKNLMAYYSLWGVGAADEPDLSGNAQTLTETGTVGVADHSPTGPMILA